MIAKNIFNHFLFYLFVFLIAGIQNPVISQHNEIFIGNTFIKLDKNFEIIAKVGDLNITAGEFLINYEYGPAFLKRSKDSKRRYLDLMIYEKLLALEAYDLGFNDSLRVKQSIIEIEADLITEELYKADVLNNISISDEEIDAAAKLNNQHITLKWIYSVEKDEIYNLQEKTKEGAVFDSLFYFQVNDTVTFNDRSLETTRFNLKIKNPELSDIIDTLKIGMISSPIKGSDGWYLVKITDGWTNVMMTEMELAEKKKELEQNIIMKKSEKLSDQYVHNIMNKHNPVIDKNTFEMLMALIGKSVLPGEKYSEWDLSKVFNNEPAAQNNFKIKNYSDLILVKYDIGNIHLKEFLDWYNLRTAYIKFNTSSKQSFFVSLQKLIWRKMRDKLLTELAYQNKIEDLDIVKIQKKWWEEKILYSALKSNIAASIEINDEQLREYYDKNKKEFLTTSKKQIPFEKAKNNVKSALSRQIYMKKILHRILKLKQKYEIIIDEDILGNLKVDMENNPRAINVYTVKKNGTIPRQAYPTVDYDWQSWY